MPSPVLRWYAASPFHATQSRRRWRRRYLSRDRMLLESSREPKREQKIIHFERGTTTATPHDACCAYFTSSPSRSVFHARRNAIYRPPPADSPRLSRRHARRRFFYGLPMTARKSCLRRCAPDFWSLADAAAAAPLCYYDYSRGDAIISRASFLHMRHHRHHHDHHQRRRRLLLIVHARGTTSAISRR